MPADLAGRPGAALRRLGWTGALVAALGGPGCTPSYDWRQLAWAGGVELLMPCKPERLARQLPLAGAPVAAQMVVCEAGGLTWSATAFELGAGQAPGEALAALQRQFADNLGAPVQDDAGQPFHPAGLDALAQARRVHWRGHRPGGAAVQADAAFAARGRWVYQLVVLAPGAGTTPAQQAAIAQFIGGLRRGGVGTGAGTGGLAGPGAPR